MASSVGAASITTGGRCGRVDRRVRKEIRCEGKGRCGREARGGADRVADRGGGSDRAIQLHLRRWPARVREGARGGDYYGYEDFAADKDLAAFLATPQGAAVSAVAAQIRDEYAKRIKGGLWLIGRRSPFRWPDKAGVQYAYSRGEVYAFDRETKRIFRLTHTDHQVIAFARAASETAVIGFDKVDHPADGSAPSIAHPWLEVHAQDQKLVGT